jgi:hypothetical protein
MPVWPVSLPPLGQTGAQIAADDSVLRSQMDAGPPTRRNRFTAITKSVSYIITLDGEQVETLDGFFHDTLRNGALSFDWIDPRNDSAAVFAFASPPQYTGLVGAEYPAERLWRVSLSLEIQP